MNMRTEPFDVILQNSKFQCFQQLGRILILVGRRANFRLPHTTNIMNNLTFWQYLKLNKQTTLSCLKITSLLFAAIATGIAVIIKYSKGSGGRSSYGFHRM